MIRSAPSYFSLLIFVAVSIFSCDKPPTGDRAIITDEVLVEQGVGDAFEVDTVNSWVRFTGHGMGKDQLGTINVVYGSVMADGDKVTGGTFLMDFASLAIKRRPEQEGETDDAGPVPRLLTGDIFEPETFGTSEFVITKIEPYKPKEGEESLVKGANFSVSGNLQVKNVTKNITFPARIDLDGDRLEGEADFDIDRRQWALEYGDGLTLDDNFFSEKVNIELHIEALREGQALEL